MSSRFVGLTLPMLNRLLGLTGTSATLVLYAEGAWTPAIAGSSTPGSQTYSLREGRYIRIGNLVTCWGRAVLSNLDATTAGVVTITGLPFTARTNSAMGYSGSIGGVNNLTHTASYPQYGLIVTQGTAVINVIELGKDAAANVQLPVSGLGATGANTAAFGHFSVTYEAA